LDLKVSKFSLIKKNNLYFKTRFAAIALHLP